MAWRFRKSLKLGPMRPNLSKSGVGGSIGVRGFRVGQDAKGRSYMAASIPGTGLYSRTYSSQGHAAGGNAAPMSGDAAARQSGGAGLAVGMLALAFVAGALVTVFLSAVLSTPTHGFGSRLCSIGLNLTGYSFQGEGKTPATTGSPYPSEQSHSFHRSECMMKWRHGRYDSGC